MGTAPGQPVTRRRWRTWRAKRVAFIDADGSSLRRVLEDAAAADAERVYLVGPRVGGDLDGFSVWYLAVPEGWEADPAGHYLESTNQHVLRYRHCETGRKVEIHRAAAWFGEDHPLANNVDACANAYTVLSRLVGATFDGGTLLATPATTGRDLLLRSLGSHEYPVCDFEAQEVIRHTSGQGRIELFPHDAIPALAEYDGRLMYAALCWGLGSGLKSWVGVGTIEDEWEADPYRRARYRVRFTVPPGWRHVGILPVWDHQDGRWSYPAVGGTTHTSWSTYETWVDGAEVLIAKRCGWHIDFLERIEFNPPQGAGPLSIWAQKLSALRSRLQERHESLAANGVRSIILHSIGSFHGSPHKITRSAPIDQPAAVPASAVGLRVEGERLVWGEYRPAAWPELCHPEWSAAIWARCRARLLSGPAHTGALHVPAGQVVAFRTDALYLTERQPWRDDGRAGRLVLRSYVPGPMPGPQSVAELLRLRDRGRNG